MKNISTGRTTKGQSKNVKSIAELKNTEVWYQDPEDGNLWHGTHGVIVNTAALVEREFFYNIERVSFNSHQGSSRTSRAVAYA
jgi:hypothetical protein